MLHDTDLKVIMEKIAAISYQLDTVEIMQLVTKFSGSPNNFHDFLGMDLVSNYGPDGNPRVSNFKITEKGREYMRDKGT